MPYTGLGHPPDDLSQQALTMNPHYPYLRRPGVDQCPICELPIERAIVLCSQCGEELPMRVVVVSEGSQGESYFAVVKSTQARTARPPVVPEEENHGRCVDTAGT